MRVPPRMPAAARESIARGVMARDAARMASGMPGVRRSQTARVASGVTSRGEKPVPPVVTTRAAPVWSARRTRAASMSGCSSGTTPVSRMEYPASSSREHTSGPASSGRWPRKLRSLTVRTAAVYK